MDTFLNFLKEYYGIIGTLIAFIALIVAFLSYYDSSKSNERNEQRHRRNEEREERRQERIRKQIAEKNMELAKLQIANSTIQTGDLGRIATLGFGIYSQMKIKKLEKEIEKLEDQL